MGDGPVGDNAFVSTQMLANGPATAPGLERRCKPDFRWHIQGTRGVCLVANRRVESSVLITE
jgi:hypothetical protein